MKSLFFIITFFTFLLMGCVNPEEYPYKIQTERETYWVKSYEKTDNDCIKFNHECGCSSKRQDVVTVCGNYTIIKYGK